MMLVDDLVNLSSDPAPTLSWYARPLDATERVCPKCNLIGHQSGFARALSVLPWIAWCRDCLAEVRRTAR